MSFSQATIVEVYPPVWTGSALHLEWLSTAPTGTVFQLYLDRALAWHGTNRWVTLPMPRHQARIDVGAVGPGEGSTDFSANLPAAPRNRAELSWLGGTYLVPDGSDDIAGFRVYGETVPGGGIERTTPLTEMVTYAGGLLNDGFGLGGFGQGGFGRSASSYRWTSPPLGRGAWSFAIVPFDHAGNEGTASITQVTITAPPGAPSPLLGDDTARLAYSYDANTRRATLSWNPSPG